MSRAAALLLLAAGGCTGFHEVGGSVDAAADLMPAAPPSDFECAEPWTAPTRSDPHCAARRVIFVESVRSPHGLSLARTGTGHIGICYDTQGPTAGAVHVSQFLDSALVPNASDFSDVPTTGMGPASAVSADADTLHVVFLNSLAGRNEIAYRHLLASGFTSATEYPVAGLSNGAELALAAPPDGSVHLVYYDRGAGVVYGRRRTGGLWSNAAVIEPDLAALVPGAGSVRLAVDGNGRPHLAMFYDLDATRAQPHTAVWDGQAWSAPRALDDAAAEIAGLSVSLALLGDGGFASYFAVPSAGGAADLRLASWRSETDTPELSPLLTDVPSDPTAPQQRAALAIDPWGLLHIAVLIPAESGLGRLEYRRQSPGGLWLVDVVDDAAVSPGVLSFVDLTVDERGRPHIAYYDGRGTVWYATRTDR